jgi:hypothetical protein
MTRAVQGCGERAGQGAAVERGAAAGCSMGKGHGPERGRGAPCALGSAFLEPGGPTGHR